MNRNRLVGSREDIFEQVGGYCGYHELVAAPKHHVK